MKHKIETERLLLVLSAEGDMEAMIAAEASEEMKLAYGEMLAGAREHPAEAEFSLAWLMKEKSAPEKTVGDLCFKGLCGGILEIGYGIHPEYEGRGYMTEAVRALCEEAKADPRVKRIEAEASPDNPASLRVLEKCGFFPNGETGKEGIRFTRK